MKKHKRRKAGKGKTASPRPVKRVLPKPARKSETHYGDMLHNASMNMVNKLDIGAAAKKETIRFLKNEYRSRLILVKIEFGRKVNAKDVLNALKVGRKYIDAIEARDNRFYQKNVRQLTAGRIGLAFLENEMRKLGAGQAPAGKEINAIKYALKDTISDEISRKYLTILLGSEAKRYSGVMERVQSSLKQRLSIEMRNAAKPGTLH